MLDDDTKDPMSQPRLFRDPKPIKGTKNTEPLIQRYLADRRADVADAIGVCESEIEVDLAMAMLCAGDAEGPFLRLTATCSCGGKSPWAKGRAGVLYAQHPAKIEGSAIRIDFVLVTEMERVAIECDGNDWHHLTPEQAERDKARDRALTADGWTPVRFTGRDIVRNPEKCAAYLMELAKCKPGVPPPLALVNVVSPAPAPPPPEKVDYEATRRGAIGVLAGIAEESKKPGVIVPFAPVRRRPR